SIISSGGVVRVVVYPGGSILSRKQVGELESIAKIRGASGLIGVKVVENNNLTGCPVGKLLSKERKSGIINLVNAQEGDLLCIVAGDKTVVAESLGAVRLAIADREDLRSDNLEFLWVTEFPLFEYSEENNRYTAMHHPFTAPMDEDIDLMESAPDQCRAKAYDLVLNGVEIGGGSVRIHNPAIQKNLFHSIGISDEKAKEQFGFFLEALSYGTPPHCGIAFGLDRMIMLLAETDNLRDVIAFPKTLQAVCLMTQAPSPVTSDQLDVVGLKMKKIEKAEQ
ncbi:hypothetical protein K8T06_00340, partial [bacterium]|nr:hypothetical protein [bacterium]